MAAVVQADKSSIDCSLQTDKAAAAPPLSQQHTHPDVHLSVNAGAHQL